MDAPELKTRHLTKWGNSLLNKLPARSRKRRLRDASKRRRQCLKKILRDMCD